MDRVEIGCRVLCPPNFVRSISNYFSRSRCAGVNHRRIILVTFSTGAEETAIPALFDRLQLCARKSLQLRIAL
jgi:hypothetical protein